MKKIFNLALFFIAVAFTLVFSLFSEGNSVHAQQPIKTVDSIQSIQRETVVLISNNILKGEISSRQKENNNSFTGTYPVLLTYNPVIVSPYKTTLQFNGEYNPNISNNEEKTQKIRAP